MIKLFNIRTHEWPRVSLLFLMTILTNVGSTWGLTITYAGFLKQIGMLEIISKSGGNLLEFTGDAMLIQFPRSRRQNDTAQAVRAGLRMQRGMARFAEIEIPQRTLALGMRIGVHPGRFLAADIGTPLRMVHVLLGKAVREAKKAEGSGRVGRVCLTEAAVEHIKRQFRCEDGEPGYGLVIDDLTDEQLGAYEITMPRRRSGSKVLFDRSVEGLVTGIEELLGQVEPLASFIPKPILNLLVENAAKRQIPPDFPTPTILFMNLLGLPEAIDHAQPGEEEKVVNTFLRAFALINAAVDARGGVLKRVTYHLAGSAIVICFGTPTQTTLTGWLKPHWPFVILSLALSH